MNINAYVGVVYNARKEANIVLTAKNGVVTSSNTTQTLKTRQESKQDNPK